MRILFASSNLPFPATSGGAQRTELLLRALQDLGSVDCVFLQPKRPLPELLAENERRCSIKLIVSTEDIVAGQPSALVRRFVPGVAGKNLEAFLGGGRFRWRADGASVERLGKVEDYDLVVARYLQVAATFDLFRCPQLVLDVDDYDPDRLRYRLTTAGYLKRLTLRRALEASESAHANYLPRVSSCWVSNPRDRGHSGLKKAEVLSNIPYPDVAGNLPPPLPFRSGSRRFLMVGTMSYSVNSDGVDAFIDRAWPRIKKTIPQAEFHIVGGGMSREQKRRWESARGVTAIGFVEDLREVYDGCLAAVAPLQAGAGTNIKVLEAAAFGRGTILTEIAHRGFEETLPAGKACLRAALIEDMADHCIELLGNPEKAAGLGASARQAVEQHHTFARFRQVVHQVCEKAVANTSVPPGVSVQ
jgi:polysaccharide biosynthesis protein PslH